MPLGRFGAGLSLADAIVFAVGLLVGNVPGGPAAGHHARTGGRRPRARAPRRRGQAPQRGRDARLDGRHLHRQDRHADREPHAGHRRLDRAAAARPEPTATDRTGRRDGGRRSRARPGDGRVQQRRIEPDGGGGRSDRGRDARGGRASWAPTSTPAQRERRRRRQFHFDPVLKLMSTVDERDGELWIDAKGAPEALLPRCTSVGWTDGRERPLGPDERARARAAGRRLRRARDCGCWRSPGATRRATPPCPSARRGRARPLLPRPRGDARPAPARGRRGGRALPRGGHPHHRRHRRPRPDRGRGRPAGRHRRRAPDDRHRRGARPHERGRARPAAARRTRADLRAQLAGGQAAHRRRPPRRAARRGDDRRRGQRRPRAAPRRHRRRHGPLGHRRRARGLDHGAHRRQLRHDRRRRRGGPARLRQHPQVHPLHLRPHDPGGDARSSCSRSAAARSRCR